MSLVACPACQQPVSPAAPACPRCGHPLGEERGAVSAATPGATGPEMLLWEGHPSAKALLGAILKATFFSLVVAVGTFLLYEPLLSLVAGLGTASDRFIAANGAGLRLAAIAFVVTVVGVRLGGLAWRIAVLKSHHYRISNQRILIESGIVAKRIEEIDMRTVADLEFRQGVVDRLLGIGTVTVVSSDRSAGRTPLVGLNQPREIRELVRNSAYKATRGQLFTRET
jgi:membrane protein YdbS with pleckstrin-like domain